MNPPDVLAHLGLSPHPEGGWYRETHRCERLTTIDYALPAGGFSAWHRVLDAAEVWNHHRGGRLHLHVFDGTTYRVVELGDTQFSAVVPAGVWQAAVAVDDTWVLTGCTVAPPFDFAKFEMADEQLLLDHPEHADDLRPYLK